MRVILSTPIFIKALLVESSMGGALIAAWRRGAFELITCELQLQEIRAVLQRDEVRAFIRPAMAGELLTQLRSMALCVEEQPKVNPSTAPLRNYLLTLVEAFPVDVLVTDDKAETLEQHSRGGCRIATLKEFLYEIEARY